MAADVTTILLSLGSSVITAGITTLINSSKTKAEVAKIKAETDQIILATKNLSTQVSSAMAPTSFDEVYYNGSNISQFDFDIEKKKEYDDSTGKEIGDKASGNFSIINNMINIERTNTQGRFNVTLKNYIIENNSQEFIKSNPSISQQRKIQISCEVKSLSKIKHTLNFVLREVETYAWLAKETVEVTKNEWAIVNAYLRVSPDKNFRLKIYDRFVGYAPSSIQIRNLKVIEKF